MTCCFQQYKVRDFEDKHPELSMERIVVNCVVLFCVSLLLLDVLSASEDYAFRDKTRRENLEEFKNRRPFWFGERLGRKKRNSAGSNYFENPQKEMNINLGDVLSREEPFDKKLHHIVYYTPRLGRESGEELMNEGFGDRWLVQQDMQEEEMLSQRSPPFAPRLGRRTSPFYPRLGRELGREDKSYFQ